MFTTLLGWEAIPHLPIPIFQPSSFFVVKVDAGLPKEMVGSLKPYGHWQIFHATILNMDGVICERHLSGCLSDGRTFHRIRLRF